MMKPGESANDACYRLLSVDAVRAPEGCTGDDWRRKAASKPQRHAAAVAQDVHGK
jgi:hypothetical protein